MIPLKIAATCCVDFAVLQNILQKLTIQEGHGKGEHCMKYKHVDSGSYGLFPQISLLIFVYSIFILFIYVTYRTQSSKQENPSTAVNFLPQYQLAFFNHTFLLPQTTCL